MDPVSLQHILPTAEVRGQLPRLTGLSYNSKTTENGQLFFCLRGKWADGHHFAAEAVKNGAAALVVEEFLPLDVPQVRVHNARRALALLSRHVYGHPAEKLGVVGVTGTNGKTTTAFYIREVLRELGRPVGMVGTVYNQFAGPPEPSQLTTPESLDLARLLARGVAEGCGWVVMEVSSHALALDRVQPADVDLGVVLNITRDHFEFHGTFEHYHASKERLVAELTPERKGGRPKAAILNADDPAVMNMAQSSSVPVITFSATGQPSDVYATELERTWRGTTFLLHLPGATAALVRLPMPGDYNVANALAAAAVGWQAGVPLSGIVAGLERCEQIPGRAEVIDEGQNFHVIVDFAHNPDALAKVLSVQPPAVGGKRLLVFGAEGGKDPGKRPLMGQASQGADYCVITSDNMREEDPMQVAQQIAAGLGDTPYEIVLDRRAAIARALSLAEEGDLVIIAGKGHEQTWVYGGEQHAFDDREVAREVLRHLRGRV